MTSVVAICMAPVSAFLPSEAVAASGSDDPAIDVGATAPVGEIPGAFSVDRFGQGTYDVPLEIPPNRGGLIPPIHLVNSSEAGLGQYGFGWSVTGISTITECHHGDGKWGKCLDGSPLVEEPSDCIGSSGPGGCVASTGEHAGGIEAYRTYPDSGVRVSRFTGWFVEHPDGRTTTFSGTPEHGGAIASRISDRFGNYVEIEAHMDTHVGLVLERINYTGNSEAAEEPAESMVFTDTSIQMPGRFYWLDRNRYNPCPADEAAEGHPGFGCDTGTAGTADGTGLELLSSIALCAGEAPVNGVPSQCLPPTRFEYFRQPNELEFSGTHEVGIPPNPCHGPFFGDFDGDGLSDVVFGANECGDDRLWLWTREGGANKVGNAPEDADVSAQDLDGDGSVDLLFFNDGGDIQTISRIQADGTSWSQWTESSYAGGPGISQHVIADVNNDSVADLVACEGPDDESLRLRVYSGWLDALGHNLDLVAELPSCDFGPMEVVHDFGQDLVAVGHAGTISWQESVSEGDPEWDPEGGFPQQIEHHYQRPVLVHPVDGEPAITPWTAFDWEGPKRPLGGSSSGASRSETTRAGG